MTDPSSVLRAVAGFRLPACRLGGLPDAPLDEDAWQTLTAEVATQRVWTLLADCVAEGALPTTDDQARTVFDHDDHAILSCLHLDRILHSVDHALRAAGIDARVFKGVSSAATAYPRPGLRAYSDVDLLVPGRSFDGAAAVLTRLGGHRHNPEPRPGFTAAAGKSAAFTLHGGWEVDLHRSPQGGPFGASVPTDEFFTTSHELRVGDRTVRTLSPTQLFLTACYHAVLPTDGRRLVPMLDVAFMMGAGTFDHRDVIETAQRWQGSIVVAEAVLAATRLFELEPSPLSRWAIELSPSRREIRRLRVTRDRDPRAVVALGVSTALAYPRWIDRARYVQAQAFHAQRLPLWDRLLRLERRLTRAPDRPGRTQPRTVVQVVDSLAAGGAERMAVDVGNGLARAGWDVHLVATRALGALVDQVDDGVHIHDLARRARWDLAGLLAFRRLVVRTRPAVVHAHGWSSLSFATAGLIGCLHPPAVVLHDHLPRSATDPRASSTARVHRAVAWLSVRAHVAVDDAQLRPPLRTRRRSVSAVVANGVPLDRFEPKRSAAIGPTARLVCLANLRPQKDHPTLLRAVARLRDEGRSLELHLIGDGADADYRNRCEALARELDLDEVVRFRGTLARVEEELPRFDVGVLSSRDESGPIALIEYLASGVPAVVTDVGEIPARLPDRLRRWVVPPGDVGDLAAAIAALLDLDEAERRQVAAEGREFVEGSLSIDRTVTELLAIYDAIAV